jgi:uncharacterized membrane protein (UPF0127 family)
MTLPGWIASLIYVRRARRRPPADCYLRVSNLTRHTILASRAELANTSEKRRTGLLGRGRLSSGGGLWILPCEAVHTFGMQFSIDIIYLDRKLRIKKISSDVPPWRLSACLSAHSVLELASGTIRETQTRAGDILVFSSVTKQNTVGQYLPGEYHHVYRSCQRASCLVSGRSCHQSYMTSLLTKM